MSSHCIYCTARGPAFITLMTFKLKYYIHENENQGSVFPKSIFYSQFISLSLSVCKVRPLPCPGTAPHLHLAGPQPSPHPAHTRPRRQVQFPGVEEEDSGEGNSLRTVSACIPSAPSSVAPVSLSAAAAATRGCQTTSLHENIFPLPLLTILTY